MPTLSLASVNCVKLSCSLSLFSSIKSMSSVKRMLLILLPYIFTPPSFSSFIPSIILSQYVINVVGKIGSFCHVSLVILKSKPFSQCSSYPHCRLCFVAYVLHHFYQSLAYSVRFKYRPVDILLCGINCLLKVYEAMMHLSSISFRLLCYELWGRG